MGWKIRFQRQVWTACIVASLLGIRSAGAQSAAATDAPPAQAMSPDCEDALHALGRTADVIFTGQVVAIRRHEAANGATGVVEIDFSVGEAIRGVGVGMYTVREWGGLWANGYEPFSVGQRYLMLLHAPGSAGLSSPVGGGDGAIPIRGEAGLRVAGLSAQGNGAVVDLRWVAARAVHALSYTAEQAAHPSSRPFTLRADTVHAATAQVDLAGPKHSEAPAAQGEAYPTVLATLRSWEKSDDVR